MLGVRLARDEVVGAVHLAQLRLFNLAGGVARDVGEDYAARALVARQRHAEVFDVGFGALRAWLELYYRGGYLAEALVGQADDGGVFYRVVGAQEVLYLDGVDVFSAADDYVLLAVD